MALLDVLRFFAMPDVSERKQFSRQKNRKGSMHGDSCDIITQIDGSGFGQWKHVKNSQGWPWDLRLYDNTNVYDWITEGPDGWSTDPDVGPKSFKKFIANHSQGSKLVDGVLMFPRWLDTIKNFSNIITHPGRSTFATFEQCHETDRRPLGAISHRLQGPFLIDHQGVIGNQPTMIHQYSWVDADGVLVLEENYYALDFGLVSWKLQRLNVSTGLFEFVKQTVEPNIFPADDVRVVFPCF